MTFRLVSKSYCRIKWEITVRFSTKSNLFGLFQAGSARTLLWNICYEKQHIKYLTSVRYAKYIPIGKGESRSSDLPFFVFNPPIFRISNWHPVSWYHMVNISISYPNPRGRFRKQDLTIFIFKSPFIINLIWHPIPWYDRVHVSKKYLQYLTKNW